MSTACLGSDDEFIGQLLGCFLTKFDDLLGGVSLDTLQAQDTYSARKLQGYHHADDVLRQKVAIPRAMENFQKTHKDFVDNMSVLGHVAKQKHRDQAMVKQLDTREADRAMWDRFVHLVNSGFLGHHQSLP